MSLNNSTGFCLRKSQQLKARGKAIALFSILEFTLCFYLALVGCNVAIAATTNNSTTNQTTNDRNNNQNTIPTEFEPSPLDLPTDKDPLLPRTAKDRAKHPLTPEEKAELATALDQLNAEAAAKLAAEDTLGAFEIWYRELRLRRYLGPVPEVQALGRVGEIAWLKNQRQDVQYITKRMQQVQQLEQTQAQKKKQPVDLELVRSLGVAYQQVQAPNLAIPVYEELLAAARQQQDTATEEAMLQTIGELAMSYFDYNKAAMIYRELLERAETKGDRLNQIAYLKQLSYIYDQSKQHQLAIKTKEQLVELYLTAQNFVDLPTIKLSTADNYEALGLLDSAAQTYQEVYAFAYQQQMFDRAAEALEKLGNLFETTKQAPQALEVYQILLMVEQQIDDFYGLMNTYDKMGRIYFDLKDYPQAMSAFQNGLAVAQRLSYRETYFAQRITQVTKQSAQEIR